MFTSKWAQKLLSKVTKSIGLSSTTSNASASSSGAAASAMIADPVLHHQSTFHPLPTSTYAPPSIPLLRITCQFWSFTLSLASHSKIDSVPWKAISSLVFSTRIIDRLWAAVHFLLTENQSLDKFATSYDPLRDNLNQNEVNKAEERRSGTYFAIAALVAVLKIVLITVDDMELYDEAVRFLRYIYFLSYSLCIALLFSFYKCEF